MNDYRIGIFYAKFDEAIRAYSVSAFLIAQFGKNYAVKEGKGIFGDALMDLACPI